MMQGVGPSGATMQPGTLGAGHVPCMLLLLGAVRSMRASHAPAACLHVCMCACRTGRELAQQEAEAAMSDAAMLRDRNEVLEKLVSSARPRALMGRLIADMHQPLVLCVHDAPPPCARVRASACGLMLMACAVPVRRTSACRRTPRCCSSSCGTMRWAPWQPPHAAQAVPCCPGPRRSVRVGMQAAAAALHQLRYCPRPWGALLLPRPS